MIAFIQLLHFAFCYVGAEKKHSVKFNIPCRWIKFLSFEDKKLFYSRMHKNPDSVLR